jgi:hypothetical protein
LYSPPNGTAKSLIAQGAPTLLVNLRFRGNDVKKAERGPIRTDQMQETQMLKARAEGPKRAESGG